MTISPTSPPPPIVTVDTSAAASTPDAPLTLKRSSASPEAGDNKDKLSGSSPRVPPSTAARLAASPLQFEGGKRMRSVSNTSQTGDEVDRHRSKMARDDESSSPDAHSHSGRLLAKASSSAAATANRESFDDKPPFHYATVLKMPKGAEDIVLVDEEIHDFKTELSGYLNEHGDTREIPANEPQLPWNLLKFLKMPSIGNWVTSGGVSDAFPCTLSPKELAEQLGCHVGDLRHVFFMDNQHADTTELLLLKTKDIGSASDSDKTLEAVVKKIYTDAVIEGTEFLEHLGVIKKELYHYHMQEDLWQSGNTAAARPSAATSIETGSSAT